MTMLHTLEHHDIQSFREQFEDDDSTLEKSFLPSMTHSIPDSVCQVVIEDGVIRNCSIELYPDRGVVSPLTGLGPHIKGHLTEHFRFHLWPIVSIEEPITPTGEYILEFTNHSSSMYFYKEAPLRQQLTMFKDRMHHEINHRQTQLGILKSYLRSELDEKSI